MEIDERLKPNLKPAFLGFAIVIVLWLINALALGPPEHSTRGTLGDMFGAVNALFSGLALAGVIYAIVLQRNEIAVARQELSHTKEILNKQQDQLESQNSLTRKQNFESTFFQLIQTLNSLTENTSAETIYGPITPTSISHGKDAFHSLINIAKNQWKNSGSPDSIQLIDRWYQEFHKKNNIALGHYYRTLFNLIRYIDQSNVDDKVFYAKLVRAQLSDAEATLLFYNCNSIYGREKFLPLARKYNLFKNVISDWLFDQDARDKLDAQT